MLGSGELIEFDGGGDEDFDPLKRTARSDSIRSNRANSMSTPQVGIAAVTTTGMAQPAQSSSNGLLGDLASVDLSNTSSTSTPPTTHREQPFFAALQPLQPAGMSGGAMTSGQPLISTGNTGVYPPQQQQGALLNQGGVLYAPVGQTYGGGVAQGGGAQQVPMMYMSMTGQQRAQYGAQVCVFILP